ncbi:hypothetical protein ACLG6S_11690 [Thermodesulfobacteriota bacterium B35]
MQPLKKKAIKFVFSILLIMLSPPDTHAGKTDTQVRTYSEFSRNDLNMLGVTALPENSFLQDTYKGIKFIATPKKVYSKEQLALLKYFIDRTPYALLKYPPSAIINAEAGFMPTSMAQASGPYVYFDSGAFHTGGFWSAGSIEGVFRGFVHELVHVLQFRKTVRSMDLAKARKSFQENMRQTFWNYALMNTDLISSFVKVTGWELNKSIITTARLKDFSHEKTSSYGRSSIMEDMAETVSFVAIGDLSPLSRQRVTWAIDLLGYPSLEKTLEYTFPYNGELEATKIAGGSRITQFDQKKKQAYEKKYFVSDIGYFVSKSRYSKVIHLLKEGFRQRKWRNILSKNLQLKHHVKKAVMEYHGKWRDIYLEVISFEEATGYLINLNP